MRIALSFAFVVAACGSSPTTTATPLASPTAATPPHAATPDDLPAQPAITAVARAAIPEAGILVATRTDRGSPPLPASSRPDAYLLYKITRDGAVEVAREEATTVQALAWLDHHTLLVYRETAVTHEGSLTRVVDGVAGTPTAIPLAAWQPTTMNLEEDMARLAITKTGEVWLERCTQRKDEGDLWSACLRPVSLRIDAAPFTRVEAAAAADPVRRVDQWRAPGHLDGATLPTVPAPTGYALDLFPVPPSAQPPGIVTYTRGFRCTSPKTKFEWPGDSDWIETQNVPDFRPTAATWVRATPPAYALTGIATDAIRTRTITVLFRACETWPATDAVYFGNDSWAEMDVPVGPSPGVGGPDYVHSTWLVIVAGQRVAVLVGSQTWFAPQPP